MPARRYAAQVAALERQLGLRLSAEQKAEFVAKLASVDEELLAQAIEVHVKLYRASRRKAIRQMACQPDIRRPLDRPRGKPARPSKVSNVRAKAVESISPVPTTDETMVRVPAAAAPATPQVPQLQVVPFQSPASDPPLASLASSAHPVVARALMDRWQALGRPEVPPWFGELWRAAEMSADCAVTEESLRPLLAAVGEQHGRTHSWMLSELITINRGLRQSGWSHPPAGWTARPVSAPVASQPSPDPSNTTPPTAAARREEALRVHSAAIEDGALERMAEILCNQKSISDSDWAWLGAHEVTPEIAADVRRVLIEVDEYWPDSKMRRENGIEDLEAESPGE